MMATAYKFSLLEKMDFTELKWKGKLLENQHFIFAQKQFPRNVKVHLRSNSHSLYTNGARNNNTKIQLIEKIFWDAKNKLGFSFWLFIETGLAPEKQLLLSDRRYLLIKRPIIFRLFPEKMLFNIFYKQTKQNCFHILIVM